VGLADAATFSKSSALRSLGAKPAASGER